ncbi:MAG: POTRA domain-containing protein, partial [Myxococcaceae bacterium]
MSAIAQPFPLPQRPPSNEPTVVGVEMHFYGAYADASSAAELRRKLSKLVSVHKGQPLLSGEVRRSIELLFETDTLADVVARAEDAPGGVRVIFEITPKRRIAQVGVQGNRVLTDEEVVSAAKLEPGSEYYPERVTAAVEVVTQHYRRRGYNQVKIETQAFELPNGLELLLTVEEGEPTRLNAVTVGGSPGLPLNRILTSLDLQLGQVLDLERLDGKLEQLRGLYRAEKYYRAQVAQPVVSQRRKGAQLLLPISAGPKYDIQFRGSRSMPDSMLLPALGYDGTETLEPSLIGRLARRLELFYRYRGYHDVRVRAREVPSPNRSHAALLFEVEEGLPLRVEQIDFVGNQAVSTRELRQILMDVLGASEPVVSPKILLTDDPVEAEGREARDPIVAPRPSLDSVLIEEAYRQAAEVMTSYFRDRGYLQAEVTVEALDIDVASRRVRARFVTEEGVQTLIESIKYAGLPTALGVKAPGGVKQGQPLSYASMEQERAKLAQELGRKGHIFARVEANAELSADGRSARVSYAVDPGPRVLVGQVIVRGLVQSSEPMVRGNLRLHEGDVLDSEMLFESQRNLVTMEIFRQATVQLLRPEVVEAQKDILVEVRERATLTGDFSLGYSVVDGVRSTLEGIRPNLLGRGVNVVGRLKLAV